jgi:hypothetical protein
VALPAGQDRRGAHQIINRRVEARCLRLQQGHRLWRSTSPRSAAGTCRHRHPTTWSPAAIDSDTVAGPASRLTARQATPMEAYYTVACTRAAHLSGAPLLQREPLPARRFSNLRHHVERVARRSGRGRRRQARGAAAQPGSSRFCRRPLRHADNGQPPDTEGRRVQHGDDGGVFR